MIRVFRFVQACAFAVAIVSDLRAQVVPSARFLDVGSERERLLRALQTTGDVPVYPWSIRGFSPAEWDWLAPRTGRGLALLPPESHSRPVGAVRLEFLPIEAGTIYNSQFPYGFNDGPVWAGRGVTGVLSGGVAGRVGPLSFQFEPTVFDAQNAQFALRPNGVATDPFQDGFFPYNIDLPQRFGNASYGRFDLGQSSIRLDVGPVMAEISSADQWWGPAIDNPLILGNNAGGFKHVSLGTSRPLGIWIGKVHARVVYGRLEQSAFSLADTLDAVRFMSGIVGIFTPRGVPGLELGATRFFHDRWPTNGWTHAPFSKPFEGILKQQLSSVNNVTGDSPDNQLASLFMRWVFPSAGFELYGEYGREDHNQDARDFWLELDHDAGYSLGLQKVWVRPSNSIIVLRTELLNTRLSHLEQGRLQTSWYLHGTSVAQGHTNEGQLLAAPAGYGGGGATVAVDLYNACGRWTFAWNRLQRAEHAFDIGPDPSHTDVMHALTVERRYDINKTSLFGGITSVMDLNRSFTNDVFNLNLRAGARTTF